MYSTVLYELAILLTHFIKEYFNSFDDIQFFHTFSSISRDMKIVTLKEIHRYIQNFMLYKMIYFSSHKFAFLNLRFSPFSSITREICVQIKNKVHPVNQLIEADLLMCIHLTFSKKATPLHSTHSTQLFKIFFSLLTLSTAFLQKASGSGKNNIEKLKIYEYVLDILKLNKCNMITKYCDIEYLVCNKIDLKIIFKSL